jgi:hypothetical protein
MIQLKHQEAGERTAHDYFTKATDKVEIKIIK